MSGLTKAQLEALAPGFTSRPDIPADMFLTREDARTIICGLLPDGLDVTKLSPKAREEIRAAIDAVLRNHGQTRDAK